MSRGFLIFAFNNEVIDYLGHALWIADRIERILGLPTSIVTDTKSAETKTDVKHNLVLTDAIAGHQRNFDINQQDKVAEWKNVNRFQAYDLSPYDETVVIDSDYIVNSAQLLNLFGSQEDFLVHRKPFDITDRDHFQPYDYLPRYQFPHYWATVIYFKKTQFAKQMFEVMQMIKENYSHYARLYKFRSSPFRNDYAVSIAMSIMYGHRINSIPVIPWNMPMIANSAEIKQLDDRRFEINYQKNINRKDKPMRVTVNDQDIHFLNKFSLEEMVNGN
jgi:hypothetical protein